MSVRGDPFSWTTELEASDSETVLSAIAALQGMIAVNPDHAPAEEMVQLDPHLRRTFQRLLGSLPAVIFIGRLDQLISETFISPKIEEILGYTRDEWLNDPVLWYRRLHPNDRERWSQEAAMFIQNTDTLRSTYRVFSRSGSLCWLRCEASRLVGTADGLVFPVVYGVLFDITEVKEAEQQTAFFNERLMRLNRDLEEVAYACSHDLRTPVHHVCVATARLQDRIEIEKGSDAERYMRTLHEGGRRLDRQLRGMQHFVEAVSCSNTLVPVDGGEVAQAAWRLCEGSASGTLHCSKLPRVIADSNGLMRLFTHLFSNALKFHKPEQRPTVWVRSSDDGESWRFAVQDNGIGIDPRYHTRIFRIFQRLHGRREYPGEGVGLAICRRIVFLHGGEIWLDSREGEGSTFHFTLPKAPLGV